MAFPWNKIVLVSAIGLGAYVVGQFVVFRQIEAVDYWQAKGYIDGLVRGSGDYSNAITNLNQWKDWWMGRAWLKWIVEHFYNYGLTRASELYG